MALPATIRPVEAMDARKIGELFAQLGYVEAKDGLAERLAMMQSLPRAEVLVADIGTRVVATVTLFNLTVAHEKAPWCRLRALIVDEAYRGLRVGQALLAAAEASAWKAGCGRVEATSGLSRPDAHRLYQRHAYTRESEHVLKLLVEH